VPFGDDGAQDAAAVAEGAEVALAVDAGVLVAGDLGNGQAGGGGAEVVRVSISNPSPRALAVPPGWRPKAGTAAAQDAL